ncbi:hypothetical protein RP20_CCG002000 [Aedes albopictus]|nr:hypothetical protein RP20_CCG002000 [Aedes albopictus]
MGSDGNAVQPSCSYRPSPLVYQPLPPPVSNSPATTADTDSIPNTVIDPATHYSTAAVHSSGAPRTAPNYGGINNLRQQGHTAYEPPLNRDTTAQPNEIVSIENTFTPQINHQDRPNELGISISEPLQIIQSVDGKQYIRLQNGCYVEVMAEQSNSEPPVSPIKANVTSVSKENRTTTLDDILERLTRIEHCLQKITLFMADVSKFMEARTGAPSKTSTLKKKAENFDDVEVLFPINDEEKLQSMEEESLEELLEYLEYLPEEEFLVKYMRLPGKLMEECLKELLEEFLKEYLEELLKILIIASLEEFLKKFQEKNLEK